MVSIHKPTLFLRHNRPLRALLLESQIWFCARDLGRLMGCPLHERKVHRLDEDQRRTVVLSSHGDSAGELMVSESAVYGLLAQHYHAENRSLRRWISNEVVASTRDRALPVDCAQPSLSFLQWPELSVSLLHWQSEPWIRLRDMPDVAPWAGACAGTIAQGALAVVAGGVAGVSVELIGVWEVCCEAVVRGWLDDYFANEFAPTGSGGCRCCV